MPRSTRSSASTPAAAPFVPPYPQSWLNRLIDWIDRLPGSAWPYYLLVATLSTAAFVGVQAQAGMYAVGFVPVHVFLALQPVGCLAVMHHLSRLAGESFRRFAPALDSEASAPEEARYRLTTLPPGPALIGAVGGLVLILGYMSQGQAGVEDMRVAFSPFFVAFSLTMGLAYGTLFAFSIHQIRAIRDLHARATTVDVYHPDPLYAFSPIAARTAIALVLITFGWSASEPAGRSDLLSFLNGLFVMALALLVFISPLWGAHRMLVHAKRRALSENASRFRSAAAEVHRQLDLGKTAGMDGLNRAMATLDLERAHLARTPTWPWQAETFRGLIAAIALPVVVWLIQFGLQRWLG